MLYLFISAPMRLLIPSITVIFETNVLRIVVDFQSVSLRKCMHERVQDTV